ncbi:hypothetical protein E3T37_13375 [Cryobacterium sp. TMT2-10]|nr:MJ0042-type zinc finger domain-containing protein [Cryobacterium sp. TMT2-10]TFD36610.1 hypothetical protein E3T37_13375 [Cryobacterium sp. TMT2-10]
MATSFNITCPHCRTTFRNQVITRHGAIRCGHCGKTITI